jgi:hypothetical protein
MSASSPEELETLLEDGVLLGDEAAVLSWFDEGAVLITGPRVTGPETALAELAALGYVAATRSDATSPSSSVTRPPTCPAAPPTGMASGRRRRAAQDAARLEVPCLPEPAPGNSSAGGS